MIAINDDDDDKINIHLNEYKSNKKERSKIKKSFLFVIKFFSIRLTHDIKKFSISIHSSSDWSLTEDSMKFINLYWLFTVMFTCKFVLIITNVLQSLVMISNENVNIYCLMWSWLSSMIWWVFFRWKLKIFFSISLFNRNSLIIIVQEFVLLNQVEIKLNLLLHHKQTNKKSNPLWSTIINIINANNNNNNKYTKYKYNEKHNHWDHKQTRKLAPK